METGEQGKYLNSGGETEAVQLFFGVFQNDFFVCLEIQRTEKGQLTSCSLWLE